MAKTANDQLAEEVAALRIKVAQQQNQLKETRALYEQVCEALRQRGIAVESASTARPIADEANP